jgi:hypothetical protein
MGKLNKRIVNKSNVKLAGVKSTIFNENSILMTSFGKGEQALFEKKISDNQILFEKSPKEYEIRLDDTQIHVKGQNQEQGHLANPLAKPLSKRALKRQRKNELEKKLGHVIPENLFGNDQIRAKNQLERLFYGENFKDNFHIQIIYNILDIQKIMSPFINDVVFSLDNLIRTPSQAIQDEALRDFVGNLVSSYQKMENSHPERFNRFLVYYREAKEYFPYFGEAFQGKNNKNKSSFKNGSGLIFSSERKIYTILRAISFIRHSIFHFKLEDKDSIFRDYAYEKDIQDLIHEFFSLKLDAINQSFFDQNAKSNFYILFNLYDLHQNYESPEAISLARKLYAFTVRKDQLNLGVSIRKLRESMLQLPECSLFKQKDFDTIRSKLNLFLDFMITEDYLKDTRVLLDFVQLLRASKNDEEKEQIYQNHSNLAWKAIKSRTMDKLVPIIKNPKDIKKNTNKVQFNRVFLQASLLTNHISSFSKLMYVFSTFLDGKDSNELLSGMIHKLLEISSMQDFLTKHATLNFKQGKLKANLNLFEQSKRIADELMLIKAIVHRGFDPVFSSATLLEAGQILGFRKKPVHLSDFDYFNQSLKEHKNNNFKNFIINNVVSSRRFMYVVRYVKPHLAKAMASHKPSIQFVLERIPSEQIDRYIRSVLNKDPTSINDHTKRQLLTEAILSLHYEQFLTVVQGRPEHSTLPKPTNLENHHKENQKALITLYLTIIYHFFKGLVRVNSRYTIGFYTFERDQSVKLKTDDIFKTHVTKETLLALLQDSIKARRYNQRVEEYLNQNQAHFAPHLFIEYRNNVSHLEALTKANVYFDNSTQVPKSYFDIYHTIMALLFIQNNSLVNQSNSFIKDRLQSVTKHRQYSSDLLHVLHVPFSYNMARYKNLSIEGLFDQNENLQQAQK